MSFSLVMDIELEKLEKDWGEPDVRASAAPECPSDATLRVQDNTPDIMKSKQSFNLIDLPNSGGKKLQPCYKEVLMPTKLYSSKDNIQMFIEQQLLEKFKVEAGWHKWVRECDDVSVFLESSTAALQIDLDLRPYGKSGPIVSPEINVATASSIFGAFDGRLKKDDKILSDKDRTCIHLLVNNKDFSKVTHQDLTAYVREARCLENTLTLIRKYEKQKPVDIELIRTYWPARPNRRFTEIPIFIAQFFGRAERLFSEDVVSKLWNSLLFVKDFIIGMEYTARAWKDKGSLKIAAVGTDYVLDEVSSLEAEEAATVDSNKKRKNASEKEANKSATKKSRSKNTEEEVEPLESFLPSINKDDTADNKLVYDWLNSELALKDVVHDRERVKEHYTKTAIISGLDVLQYERTNCEAFIKRLRMTSDTVQKLREYATTCLAEINRAFEVVYEGEKKRMEDEMKEMEDKHLGEIEEIVNDHQGELEALDRKHQKERNLTTTVQSDTDLEWRIIEATQMFIWTKKTRAEQIINSVGIDERSVTSGAFKIPGYIIMPLNK